MAKKKDKGWIKLHRVIRDNFIWKGAEPFDRRSAWIDILLSVNHEERVLLLRSGQEMVVGPGQMFTSYQSLAKRWKWSRNRVIRYLDLLANHQMVTLTGTPAGTLITANSWALYQFGGTPTGTPTGTRTGLQTGLRTGHEQELNKELNIKNVKKNKEPDGSDPDGGYQT